jgi:3-oxoacyl-[acyl-carrier protein] reductase
MDGRLTGKVALVTGGGTGIGRATSLALAAEGAAVAVNYSRSRGEAEETAAAITARGGRAITVACDVSDERAVTAMVARVTGELGRLDILVNNAGTTRFIDHRDLDAVTPEVWDRILAVNVKGTFYCVRAAARAMKDGGRIINIGSVAGVRGNGSSIPYAASKAAIHTMTLSLARALAPAITVNAIAPGLIETRWHGGHEAENAARSARFPVKRIGTPEDIAHVAVALATADNFWTGQVIVVDGGAGL